MGEKRREGCNALFDLSIWWNLNMLREPLKRARPLNLSPWSPAGLSRAYPPPMTDHPRLLANPCLSRSAQKTSPQDVLQSKIARRGRCFGPRKMSGTPARSTQDFRFISWLDNLNGAVLLFLLLIPILRISRNRLGGRRRP